MSKLHPKQAFFLIDDMANPRSGWDRDFRGADHHPVKEWNKRVYVKRVNPKYPTWAKREINRQTNGVVTFETSYLQHKGDGVYFGFYDGTEEALRLDTKEGFVYASGKKLFATSSSHHHIKLELNLDDGKAKIFHDGKFECEIPFTGSARAITDFKFGYENEAFGETEVQCCKMYKNYLVNDYVIAAYNGDLPEDYTVKSQDNTKVYRRQYGYLSYNYVYSIEASGKSDTVITRAFDKTSGKVSLELKYIVTKEGGNAKISLTSNGTNVITFGDSGSALCHKDNMLRNHSPYTVWQTLRIDADTNTSTILVYLNGKKLTYLSFDNEADFIDGFKIDFSADESGSEFMFGEIFANVLLDEPSDYVPEPVIPKKKGDYYVGMNVCSLWRDGQHHGWDCITAFDDHKPLIGFYDEGVPEVADWEIKFMAEHGVDFQLYCWYAEQINMPIMCPRLNYQWNTAHMYAKYSDKVKFALLFEAACNKPDSEDSFRKYYVPYWIDYYFSDNRYMTIDGYAIMSVYGIDRFITHMGGVEVTKRCLDYLRNEVEKLGYKGLVILACGDPRPEYKEIGIDGTHAYNWSHDGYDLEYTKARNIANINTGICHQVPTISSGFNVVAWRYHRSPNMTPEDMEKGLNWVREDILPTFEKDSWKSKLCILSTWNEYGEGTFISPSTLCGFGYLDAVRSAFCENLPHKDTVPTEEQQQSFCQLHPKDRYDIAPLRYISSDNWNGNVYRRFEFKTQEDLDKWEFSGISHYEIKNGVLCGISESDCPTMLLKETRETPVPTSKIFDIKANHLARKNSGDMCMIVFGFTADKNPTSKQYITGTISNPKVREDKFFDLRKRRAVPFTGNIYNVIIKPIWKQGYFELESIEFLESSKKYELYLDGELMNLEYDLVEKEGSIYIPFDTLGSPSRHKNMYHTWNKAKREFTVVTDYEYVFTVGSDKVLCSSGESITMPSTLELYDGIPLIPLELYATMLSKKLTSDGNMHRLD